MPTLTVVATGSTQWADPDTSGAYGFGADPHLPVADRWAGWLSRAGILFPAIPWAGIGAVSDVSLELVNTDVQTHVARGGSPSIVVRRITEKWTPNGASQHDGPGGPPATDGSTYPGASTSGTDAYTVSTPTGNSVRFSRSITKLARWWAPSSVAFPTGPGKGAAMHGVALWPVAGGANIAEVKGYPGVAAADRPRLIITYTAAPGHPTPAPVSPAGPGTNGGRYLFTSTVAMTTYDLQVRTPGAASADRWNVVDGTGGIVGGGLSADVTYAGLALTAGASYEWRVRAAGTGADSAWCAWVPFTHDPTATVPDPYDEWATHVLAQLGWPRVERDLGTLLPVDAQVAALLTLEYRERIGLVDTAHGEAIERTLEKIGLAWGVTYDDGWFVDAAAHDMGGLD